MNEMILTLDMRDDLFILDEATLNALGRPRQVQLLINTQKRKLVLRACSTEDQSIIISPNLRRNVQQKEWYRTTSVQKL